MKAQVPLRFRIRSRELQAVLLQAPLLVRTRLGAKRAHAGWWLVFDERGRPYDVYAPGDFVTAFEPVHPDQARPYLHAPPIPVARAPSPEARAIAGSFGLAPAQFVADVDSAAPLERGLPEVVPAIAAPASWWDRLRTTLRFPSRLHVGGS